MLPQSSSTAALGSNLINVETLVRPLFPSVEEATFLISASYRLCGVQVYLVTGYLDGSSIANIGARWSTGPVQISFGIQIQNHSRLLPNIIFVQKSLTIGQASVFDIYRSVSPGRHVTMQLTVYTTLLIMRSPFSHLGGSVSEDEYLKKY